MEISLLDTNGAPVAETRGKPVPGSSEWMPGEEKQVALPFQLPNVGSGTYVVAVALLDDHPLRPNNRLEMGMKNKTKDNRYVLGAIAVR
jgi:hypothetical protein